MGRKATHNISTKTARLKLKPRASAYYSEIAEGFHLGYRRSSAGSKAGTWTARRIRPTGGYDTEALGGADDFIIADGETVLTHSQAVERAREKLDLIGQKDTTVADAAKTWAAAKNLATDNPRAKLNNDSYARRITVAFKGRTLKTITSREIEAWRDGFLKDVDNPENRRMRMATANRALANLKAILTKAADYSRIPATVRPWTGVAKFSKAESFGRRTIILTHKDRKALVNAADTPEFRNLLLAALHTGARYGELCTAKIGDLNTSAGTLQLTGKTGPRTVALGDSALTFFKEFVCGVNDPERFIFLHPATGSRWKDDEQRPHMIRAVKEAGINTDTTLYTLRHSVISDWVADGVPIRAVAEQTGTSVAMIEGTYAKFLPDQRRAWFATEAL